MRYTFLFILLFFFGLTFFPDAASADGLVPCGGAGQEKCTLCHLIVGINILITYIRNVMVFFAFAVIVAMGILYIVSTGDQGMMEKAKSGIKASLIGIAIVLLAWVVINTLMFVVLDAQENLGVGADIQGVNGFQFKCE